MINIYILNFLSNFNIFIKYGVRMATHWLEFVKNVNFSLTIKEYKKLMRPFGYKFSKVLEEAEAGYIIPGYVIEPISEDLILTNMAIETFLKYVIYSEQSTHVVVMKNYIYSDDIAESQSNYIKELGQIMESRGVTFCFSIKQFLMASNEVIEYIFLKLPRYVPLNDSFEESLRLLDSTILKIIVKNSNDLLKNISKRDDFLNFSIFKSTFANSRFVNREARSINFINFYIKRVDIDNSLPYLVAYSVYF